MKKLVSTFWIGCGIFLLGGIFSITPISVLGALILAYTILVFFSFIFKETYKNVWGEVIKIPENKDAPARFYAKIHRKVFGMTISMYINREDGRWSPDFNDKIDRFDNRFYIEKTTGYDTIDYPKKLVDSAVQHYSRKRVSRLKYEQELVYSTKNNKELLFENYPESFEEKRRLFSKLLAKDPGGYEILEELLELHKMEQTN